MTQRRHKQVLFLCTGNYYRSRFAESLFNFLAVQAGLACRACSRGLALERGVNNVGPMELTAIAALRSRGVCVGDDCVRAPAQATAEDFAAAHLVVALKRSEHLPLLRERYPDWADKVEFWDVDDGPEALQEIEPQIVALVARLQSGSADSPAG
jgi:protein-tyrosine-phosphatase